MTCGAALPILLRENEGASIRSRQGIADAAARECDDVIALSAIVLTPDTYETIRPLMQSLHRQTARDRMEVVIVAPGTGGIPLDTAELKDFAAVTVIDGGAMRSSTAARAAGIRAASAPVVVLTEDHSLPEPAWAEALIRAHGESWAAVGPSVTNGNPASLTSWANFIIEYNEWLAPGAGGPVSHLPGHNSSYRRDLLLAYGDDLGMWLEAESILHWDLMKQGYRLYCEANARTKHFNFSRILPSIPLRFHAGRLFGASRSRRWSIPRRLVYVIGSPLIPFLRLRRIAGELKKPGRPRHLLLRLSLPMLFLLICDGAGEACGYAFGPGRTAQRITEMDYHRERYMNEQDQRAWETAHTA